MLFRFEVPGLAEIGFWFAPHARRRGLTEAAIGLTLRWGFEHLGLARIEGLTTPDNTHSQKAMARAGMAFQARVPDHHHPHVGCQDVVIYAAQPSDED
jgi:[ribosomal protein S5]-alanine N-acetyltransferase